MLRFYLSSVIVTLIIIGQYPLADGSMPIKYERLDRASSHLAQSGSVETEDSSLLYVSQKVIDFGTLPLSGNRKNHLLVKNMGAKQIVLDVKGPESWFFHDRPFVSTLMENGSEYLYISLSATRDRFKERIGQEKPVFITKMQIEGANQSVTYRKQLAAGTHKETLRLTTTVHDVTVTLIFRLNHIAEEPLISIEPQQIDLGLVTSGEKITSQIILQNSGRGVLRWSVTAPLKRELPSERNGQAGRYISFINNQARTTGIYSPPKHIRETLELTGKWTEEGGYPVGLPPHSVLRFRFHGTGISLINLRNYDEGAIDFFINDEPVEIPLAKLASIEDAELPIIEGLPDGAHTMSIIKREGKMTLEGVKVYKRELTVLPANLINFVPRVGTTTRETDYITLSVDTHNLAAGTYVGFIAVSSNTGKDTVEIYLDVVARSAQNLIAVYRYDRGHKYLFTSNPQADAKKIFVGEYDKHGHAFYLFPINTPGTTAFFRFYHPQKGDYFYSSQTKGRDKQLKGYILEGSIGNIATSRLANTRPLHRWFHPNTGRHFFTVDPKGEGAQKAGYRYDGIAGFVR